MTMHVMAHRELTSNPSLQSVRFFLQTRFRCKVAPPSRHSLALRAHRHRLSAFARKKNVRSRAQGNVASSEKSRFFLQTCLPCKVDSVHRGNHFTRAPTSLV